MIPDSSIKKSTLVVACTSAFISPFLISSVNVSLPAIEKSFTVNAVQLSWVATAYLLAAGAFLLPMSRWADIYGRKKMLGAGFGLLSATCLLAGFVPSISALIVLRVLQGIGSSMIFSTGLAILTSVYPPQERGKVLGIAVSAVYFGLSSGPFLGGLLTHHFSWTSLFVFHSLICMLPLYLIVRKLRGEWADAAGESYDFCGATTYAISLVAIIYGFSRMQMPFGKALFAIGGMGLWLFYRRQLKIKDPLFEMNLFAGNRAFAMSNLAALINYSGTFALTFLLSLYLQYIKAMDAQSAGLVLVSQPVVMGLFSPLAGRLSDSIEPRIIASIGMGITAVGLLAFAFIGTHTSTLLILGLLVFLGFGFAFFSSPNMNAIMGSVEKRYLGVASASAGTMRVLGQVLSMGIATFIMSIYMQMEDISPIMYKDLLQCIRVSFLVFGGICTAGVFASFARGRLHSLRNT